MTDESSKNELVVGDVVKLRSGGPLMTVASTVRDNGYLLCAWFDNEGVHEWPFDPAALTPDSKVDLNKFRQMLPERV